MIDITSVVEKMNDLQLIRKNRVINNYYSIYCPFHKDGNEKKPSFGISMVEEYRNGRKTPEGFCHCFTCGYAANLTKFVTDVLHTRSITQSGVEWLQENVPGFAIQTDFELLIPNDTMSDLTNKYAIDYIKQLSGESEAYVTEEELKQYRFTVPYMYERKLTDEIIEKFDVGFDRNWIPPGRKKPVPCITFPVRDAKGNTLFLCRRSIQGKMYNYPTGVTKPVYGLDMIPKDCKSLCICESIINALTLWTWGFEAVALLGTGNSTQISQLKSLGVREFVICTDGDDAGRKSAHKLKNNLSSCAIVWVVDFPDGKDVNDLTYEEFMKLYENRR